MKKKTFETKQNKKKDDDHSVHKLQLERCERALVRSEHAQLKHVAASAQHNRPSTSSAAATPTTSVMDGSASRSDRCGSSDIRWHEIGQQ